MHKCWLISLQHFHHHQGPHCQCPLFCYCNGILVVFISLDFLLHNVDNFSFLCIYSNFELVSVGIEIGNKNLSSGVFLNRWSIGRFCKSFFSPEETTAEDISKVPMTLYVPGSCCKNHISWVEPFVKTLVEGKKSELTWKKRIWKMKAKMTSNAFRSNA